MGDRFRIIIAQPRIVDTLLQEGIYEHLDGIFGVAPAWTMAIVQAAQVGDWERAQAHQQRIIQLLDLVIEAGVLPSVGAILNVRGILGKIGVLPARQLDAAARTTARCPDRSGITPGNCVT